MSPLRLTLASTIGAAAVVLAGAAPAAAFHHVVLPAAHCASPDQAGGNNPVAVTALRDHNPAQSLPLPPVGFDNAPVDRAAGCHGG